MANTLLGVILLGIIVSDLILGIYLLWLSRQIKVPLLRHTVQGSAITLLLVIAGVTGLLYDEIFIEAGPHTLEEQASLLFLVGSVVTAGLAAREISRFIDRYKFHER